MANYADTFESYGTGAGIPSGCTGRWNYSNGEWDRVTVTDVAVRCAAGFTARQLVSLNAVDGDADRAKADVLARIRTNANTAATFIGGVAARCSGAASNETGYVAVIHGDELRLGKYVSGTFTELGLTTTLSIATNTDYWMRLRCNSTSIQAKIWADGAGEPGSWDLSATDSSISAAGWCGMFNFGASTRHWRDLAVATNGDTASVGSVSHATSGVLTGQGSTVVGTAAHIAKHATSGVLTGQGSTVAGTAARTRAHPSSGVLAGQGAVIAGTAARTSPGVHATSGALTGQGAVVVGTAAHIAKHATSGVLVGPGATVDGTAARVAAAVTHETSGALVGQGSVIVATARNGTAAGRRRTSQRKILVTIKGARFLVPEDQLDEWLDDKEEEIVEQAIKPVTVVSKKARVIRANTSPVPKVAAQADEAWVAAAVAELNRRVQQRIADERKRLQDEDDEEVMLLLL